MNESLFESFSKHRKDASHIYDRFLITRELLDHEIDVDSILLSNVSDVLELKVLELISNRYEDDLDKVKLMRECATEAFRINQILPQPSEAIPFARHLLKLSSLAILGDRGADAVRILNQTGWSNLPLDSDDWYERTWATIIDVWLRLIRKKGWYDRDIVLERIFSLREHQNQYEKVYLNTVDETNAKSAALELIGLYHLARAAEILAQFITEGVVEGDYQVRNLLDAQFERIFDVCCHVQLLELELLTRILHAASHQMVENSIWTVTRAVNSKVSQFVSTLVDKGRGDKALFDVLPPQRHTLADQGLIGSSRRAVVVSLPTSSGKTLIAQFRILQALNQFDQEQGWVAYLAPTRALVNQVTRQLRSDFAPMSIAVEKVSPALEIDSVEMDLLNEKSNEKRFRVLVTTPEKLDLMLRQGWEKKIDRPLTLVVVDEAHNIQSPTRGLKLELLLSTINRECARAQFLLLTPFINNANEVARWLGGRNSDNISLSVDWQPNDRAIGIVRAIKKEKLNKRSYNYSLNFETIHTSRNTININELINIPNQFEIAKTFSSANNPKNITSLAAEFFKKCGPLILIHGQLDWVWNLAQNLAIETNKEDALHDEVRLLQEYLSLELGNDFPLINLLEYGIAVHHSGLPDEVRTLIEWLFERGRLKFLVATTTIAQGINFPVSGVIMASHQYFGSTGPMDMPSDDFWNIAGRAGRISQGQLGIVAMAAVSNEKADQLREFINTQTEDLNSALVQLALEARDKLNDLERIVYSKPEWSSFLQYLTHTYQQMGKPEYFTQQVEQVLRGTLGYEKLKLKDSDIARKFLKGINKYCDDIQEGNQPLGLVDSTGFSLQSIKTILKHRGDINEDSWDMDRLYSRNDITLQKMMGILLRVPELRDSLKDVTGGKKPDGDKLAQILKDWVGGSSIKDIAGSHFQNDITKCGQNLFGKLIQTASWGLAALLTITANTLTEEEKKNLSNLPAMAFYGVDNESAIKLRLLGVPRNAARSIARHLNQHVTEPIPNLRNRLANLSDAEWYQSMGDKGTIYRKVWRVIEGIE